MIVTVPIDHPSPKVIISKMTNPQLQPSHICYASTRYFLTGLYSQSAHSIAFCPRYRPFATPVARQCQTKPTCSMTCISTMDMSKRTRYEWRGSSGSKNTNGSGTCLWTLRESPFKVLDRPHLCELLFDIGKCLSPSPPYSDPS